MAWMTGTHSELKEVPSEGVDDVIAHGKPTKMVAVDKASDTPRNFASVPTSQMFSEGEPD